MACPHWRARECAACQKCQRELVAGNGNASAQGRYATTYDRAFVELVVEVGSQPGRWRRGDRGCRHQGGVGKALRKGFVPCVNCTGQYVVLLANSERRIGEEREYDAADENAV